MNFRVGQKVVCIGNDFYGIRPEMVIPRPGCVYTIRQISVHGGLFLHEIVNPKLPHWQCVGLITEPHFCGEAFRPVVSRKTDISIFTAMLNPDHVGVLL